MRDASRIVSRIAGSVIVALVLAIAPSIPALASGLSAMSLTSPTLTRILDLSFVVLVLRSIERRSETSAGVPPRITEYPVL